jgi:hypothetical protein
MATRRAFLMGAAVGTTSALLASCGTAAQGTKQTTQLAGPPSWDDLRAMFQLRPDRGLCATNQSKSAPGMIASQPALLWFSMHAR